MPNTPTGLQAKCYYNSGTHASAVLALMTRIAGLKYAIAGEEVALELRESTWKRVLAGQDEFSMSFEYTKLKGVSDAKFSAIMGSKTSKTPIELIILDGLVTDADAYGFRAYVLCTKVERTEELNAAIKYACEFKLTEFYESSVLIDPDQFTGTAP